MEHLVWECAARAVLVAMSTAALLRILRVKMAAAQHSAWTGVVILMLLLPAWTAWGPKASWRILPAATGPAAIRTAVPALNITESAPPNLEKTAQPLAPRVSNWPSSLAIVYLLGLCVLLARLAVGTIRAQMLVRTAVTRGGRLTSAACAAPVTVGWLTPTVILPECWQRWPQAQLDAVLAHEGEHARRRDPLAQWLALLNRAIFWFHPLAWWLERRLSALAEEACDAAVLERGCDRFEYSEYLLEMARSVVRTGVRVKVLGMAMPGSFLPQRIRQILEGRPAQRISRARMACLLAACALTSALFTAGAVDRQLPTRLAAPPVVIAPELTATAPTAPLPKSTRVIVAQVQGAPTVSTPEGKYKDKRLLVLYFDLQGMPLIDRARAFAAAQEFVRTKMQPSDLMSIMTANDSVKVMQDFSGDHDELLRTLDQLMSDSGPESSGAADADQQLIRLHTAVNMLGPLQGKKAVVYFSMPSTRNDSPELRPLIDAAIRANVAFYNVDAYGLILPLPANRAYTIGAGDTLQIRVVQQQGVSGAYSLRPDGKISVPLIGDIRAAGLTTAQLEAVIVDRLEAGGIVDHPSVTVAVEHILIEE